MHGVPTSSAQRPARADVWPPFIWAAIALTLVVGFGLGGALFAAPLVGLPVGAWTAAAGQVHGHVQLVGWAGLMVLGVGLHFLPRLRGRPLARPRQASMVLALLLAGLVLRSLAQPLLAARPDPLMGFGLVLSGVLEIAGLSLGLALLLATARGAPGLAARTGLVQVVPFLATAFVAFWLALLLNLLGVAAAAAPGGRRLVPSGLDGLAVLVALQGFLVPIAVAIGARTFPLHLASRPPGLLALRVGLACLLVGLGLRVVGQQAAAPAAASVGQASTALAYVLFVVGLRVFAPRRAVPGGRAAWFRDAAQWHVLAAFAWLVLDAVLLVAGLGGSLSTGADRHVLGAGFVTLLVLGEGAKLLPGFAGRPLRSEGLVWVSLVLGNAAAALRVGPVLLPGVIGGRWAGLALAGSGLAGVLAIGVFALNLWPTGGARARPAPG